MQKDLEHIADLKITASLAGATEKIFKGQILVFALIQGSQIIIIMIDLLYFFKNGGETTINNGFFC